MDYILAVLKSDTSLLPLLLPLCLWISTYCYCLVKGHSFHKWYAVHNFHNFGAILLGTLSLKELINERSPILWSLGYFFVDVVDCTVRLDTPYIFHGVCCAALGMANLLHPTCFRLRMNSKATYCELSNPFMHLAKTTRKPLHFIMFAVVFTFCRMVWLPIMYRQLLDADMHYREPIMIVLAGFYGLNCLWYYKIINIIVQAATGKPKPDKVD